MRDQGIGSWPVRRARGAGSRTAVVHEDRVETYASLAGRVRRLATHLATCGVRRGDRVAYIGPNHPAFVETMFATASLAAVFVPVNTRLARPEVAHVLTNAGARLLVTAPETADLARDAAQDLAHLDLLERDEYEQAVDSSTDVERDEAVSLDDPAMILYTSGTTGRPKGAVLTHGNLTWNTYNVLADLDIVGDDVALVCAPMFHAAALGQSVLPTFLKGATNVLVGSFDADAVLDVVATRRVTYLVGVPTMFAAMATSARWADADLSSLRMVHCGGAPVGVDLIHEFHRRGVTFTQGYGLTEAAPGVLLLRADRSLDLAGAAGQSCFFSDVRILGPDGRAVPPGVAGEIVVSGPNVMAGYWQLPDETLAAIPDGEWLRTGDVGIADDEGFISVVDRIKDMYISGGENVYPAEVEAVLSRLAGVADCAVLAVPDEKWGEVGRAVVVPVAGQSVDPRALLEGMRASLASYKVPRDVVLAEELPRNAAGKLRRQELAARYRRVNAEPRGISST